MKKETEYKKRWLPSLHIEAEGDLFKMTFLLNGVRRIVEYKPDNIVLKVSDGLVNLLGNKLCLCVFGEGTVEIKGGVREVRFSYDRR